MDDDEKLSVEERAARMLAEDLKTLPKVIQRISGRPPGVQELTPDHELWAWNYRDETILPADIAAMRERGIPDVDIARKVWPMMDRVVEQGGVTYAEQERKAMRMADRALRARQRGHVPKPPPRPEGGV